VNQKQREKQIGNVYDYLDWEAQRLAAELSGLNPMQREARWTRIAHVLKVRDMLNWAVKQHDKHLLERTF
jgi:hypothetical protein